MRSVWDDAASDLMKQGYIALGFAVKSVKAYEVDGCNVKLIVDSRSNRALFGIKQNLDVVAATLKKLTAKSYFLTIIDEVGLDGGNGNIMIELNRVFGENRLKIKD